MDPQLHQFIRETTPQLNPDITNGIATKHARERERYVDEMFRAIAKGFPPGLEYHGGTPCSPEEEFANLSKRQPRRGRRKQGVQQSKREFDIARSDTYMVKYRFTYKGEEIKTYLSLPDISDGGIIYLSGTRYLISPILADQVISVGLNDIFVVFSRSKVTFKRMNVRFYADGRLETVYQPHSQVHHKKDKSKNKPKIAMKTTMFHYLLCKYGFDETFTRFAGTRPKVVKRADYNVDDYPTDDWVACSTATMSKPKTYGYFDYVPTDLIVLVPRVDYEDPKKANMIQSMIGSFYYLADHFSQRIQPEYLESLRLWRILMGLILWGDHIPQGELHDDISTHIESLDEYVDERLRIKFRHINMQVNDIYEFFAIVIDRLSDWILGARDNISSLYGKELSVLYYVFYDLLSAINNFYFRIKAASSKKELTVTDINNHLASTIRTGFIYSLLKGSGVISTVSSPNGNKALKLTAIMVPQSKSTKMRKGDTRGQDPSKRLHVSNAEIGGFCNLPKSEPSAWARVNPCVKTDNRGAVLRDPRFVDMLDTYQDWIKQSRQPGQTD